MSRVRRANLRVPALAVVLAIAAGSLAENSSEPAIRSAGIGHGITLHYADEGTGVPVVFVHGSLSDGRYWAGQIGPFAKRYQRSLYGYPLRVYPPERHAASVRPCAAGRREGTVRMADYDRDRLSESQVIAPTRTDNYMAARS